MRPEIERNPVLRAVGEEDHSVETLGFFHLKGILGERVQEQ